MVHVDESPFATIEVVNPTTNRVHVDVSPFATIDVVNPTIDSECNGGRQTNLQGGPTMRGAKTTRPLVHDHIPQREELKKEKNRKHKQASRARLIVTNDKIKGFTSRNVALLTSKYSEKKPNLDRCQKYHPIILDKSILTCPL